MSTLNGQPSDYGNPEIDRERIGALWLRQQIRNDCSSEQLVAFMFCINLEISMTADKCTQIENRLWYNIWNTCSRAIPRGAKLTEAGMDTLDLQPAHFQASSPNSLNHKIDFKRTLGILFHELAGNTLYWHGPTRKLNIFELVILMCHSQTRIVPKSFGTPCLEYSFSGQQEKYKVGWFQQRD